MAWGSGEMVFDFGIAMEFSTENLEDNGRRRNLPFSGNWGFSRRGTWEDCGSWGWDSSVGVVDIPIANANRTVACGR